jgi:hypothetical protein
MPRAYGSDRVSPAGSAFFIVASRDKGWRGRTPATLTTSEFPGTAVEWDGVMYEVVALQKSGSGIRYRLEPWKDEQIVRQMEHYDAPSEAARLARWNDHARRMHIGQWIERFGFATGLLPAEAQRHFATRFGVTIRRLMLWSTIPYMIFGTYCARYLQIPGLPSATPPFPEWVLTLGFYLFGESLVRLRGYLGSNPMGSIFGWAVYLPWLALGGHKTLARLDEEDLRTASGVVTRAEVAKVQLARPHREVRQEWGDLPAVDADPERKLHDAYMLREPYIALLSAAEQVKMHERFGFDPVEQGKRTVTYITIVAGLGATVSILMLFTEGVRISRIASAVTAVLLIVEQFGRMRLLAEGQPAPSVLAPLVRPFLRKTLDAPPVQPVYEGEGRNVELPDLWDERPEK